MNKVYEQALRDYQEKIAGVLIVKNIISDLEPYLTKVEYLQVKSKLGNMAQVDELFRILLTKGNRYFKGFCHVLEDNGYQHWAQQLRSSTDGAETEGTYVDVLKLGTCTVLLIRDCRRHTTLHTISTVCQVHVLWSIETALSYLPSWKARQLILMPKSQSICIYVCMSVKVNYRHLSCGLEIVSVAIPMASSCSIYLYNILNSRFRLIPILHSTCGGQFGDRLR